MSEIFYGYNFLNEYLVARDLKQKMADAERDRKLNEMESMEEPINVYDARLMVKLFGLKSLEDIKDIF